MAAAGTAGVGCGDDDEKKPGTIIPGTGGRPGTGGAVGTGGTVATGGAAATSGAVGTGGTDASVPVETGGAPDVGAMDLAGTGGTTAPDATPPDEAIDEPVPTPDTTPPIDNAPPVDTGAPIVVTQVAQINCPQLLGPAATCNGSGSTCTQSAPETTGNTTTVRYCHQNMVKKVATHVGTTATVLIKKTDGSACYTLEITPGATTGSENWVYKSPTGDPLATAVSVLATNVITLTCNGATYIIDTDNVDSPATDGEPGPGECATGTCSVQ